MRDLLIAAAWLAAPLSVGAQERIQDFIYEVSVDPMDDSRFEVVGTVSPDESAMLAWTCSWETLKADSIELSVYTAAVALNVGMRLTPPRSQVRYRIDQQPASGWTTWRVSSSGEVSTLADEQIQGFTEAMKAGRKVLFRVRDPLSGRTHDAEFSLMGLIRALERLDCGI